MTAVSKRQRARFYIHKKRTEIAKNILYKRPDTWQKARKFASRFHIQKSGHFTLRDLL